MSGKKLIWLNTELENLNQEKVEIHNKVSTDIHRVLNIKYNECWEKLQDSSPEEIIDGILDKLTSDLLKLKSSDSIQELNKRFSEIRNNNKQVKETISKTQEEILGSLSINKNADEILLVDFLKPKAVRSLAWTINKDVHPTTVSLSDLVKLCTKYVSWEKELLRLQWIGPNGIESIKKLFSENNISI